ncbi:MAG: LysE family translocator [Lautropia sp.]
MTWTLWGAFVAATLVLLIIPGPTVLTVIGYSISHGSRARWPLVAAVALGDSTALLLSLLGLGTLLAASALWFGVVKWIGGGYLIWLGLRMLAAAWRTAPAAASVGAAGPGDAAGDAAPRLASRRQLFAQTYLVTALNPKGIVFFVAFLPQFLTPAAPVAPQLWLLSVTFVVLATLSAGLYALFASQARRLLATPRARRRFESGGGALLVGAGVWALLARRPA